MRKVKIDPLRGGRYAHLPRYSWLSCDSPGHYPDDGDAPDEIKEYEYGGPLDESQDVTVPVDEFDPVAWSIDSERITEAQLEMYNLTDPRERKYSDNEIVKMNLLRCGGNLTLGKWYQIQRLWGWSCAYCGSQKGKLQLEHIIPVSKNGATDVDNVVPACYDCNTSKRSKDVKEWLGKRYDGFRDKWNNVMVEINK